MQRNRFIRYCVLAVALVGALVLVAGCKSGQPIIINPGQSSQGGGGATGPTAKLCNADTTGDQINRDAAMQVDCPVLSDYHLFKDSTDPLKNPNGNGMPYVVTTLLFSNYASKARIIYVPKGKKVVYHKNDPFTFPVGTIIAKTFYFHKDLRDDTSSPDLIETRLLIHRKDGWTGIPYVWNASKSQAVLMKYGAHVEVPVTGLNGQARTIPYDVPTVHQCSKCHRGADGKTPYSPIGPKARYLNYTFKYPDGKTENQLVHMTKIGMLTGAPADPAKNAPKSPQAFDVFKPPSKVDFSTKSNSWVDSHARAYMDANCGYCHRKKGYAGYTGVYLTDNTIDQHTPDITYYGVCHRPTSAGRGEAGLNFDIIPGNPDKSILMYRVTQDTLSLPGGTSIGVLMPPISRSVEDKVGVKLLKRWVTILPQLYPNLKTCGSGNL